MRGAILFVLAGVCIAALLLGAPAQFPAAAAPAAIPTPAAVTRPAPGGFAIYTPFNARSITTTTTATCVDVVRAATVDVAYVVDQTTINTVTLLSMWSIDGSTLVTGTAIAADVAADTTDMTQLHVFGRYLCVRVTTANTNTVGITVQALAK